MSLTVGDTAPLFELPARPGETVDLADIVGDQKILLLFFPLAFSSVCTRELRQVREDWSDWTRMDARVLAISVDSPFVTERFRASEELPFDILSDFNKDVSKLYGVLADELVGLRGVSKRAAFVIDREGRIAYRWVTEDAGVEPDYETLKQAAQAAA